jgi:hypothetical protein
VLRDVDQAFAKAANLAKHILQTVGRLLLKGTLGKKIVHLFEESDMAQFVGLSLT